MTWLDKLKSTATNIGNKITGHTAPPWLECKRCQENIYIAEAEVHLYVCQKCDYHFRVDAWERIRILTDRGSFVEQDKNMISLDPLKFTDKKKYKDRIKSSVKENPTKDAIVCGTGKIEGHTVEICAFEFKFMGGSMGSVVGEKIARAFERATENKTPLIIVSCSGGARMQEGILSLMQMPRTVIAVQRMREAGLPLIVVLTDPTSGGVTASYAMLGDVALAEPGAFIGFAGPRVIEQTIRETLPPGFQRAEYLLEHGMLVMVVHRHQLRATLSKLVDLLRNSGPKAEIRALPRADLDIPPTGEIPHGAPAQKPA